MTPTARWTMALIISVVVMILVVAIAVNGVSVPLPTIVIQALGA